MLPIFRSYNLVRRDGQGKSTLQFGVIIAVIMPKCQQGYDICKCTKHGSERGNGPVRELCGDLVCLESRVQMEKREEGRLERLLERAGSLGHCLLS